MDTPSDEGFVVHCDGKQYAAHAESAGVGSAGPDVPSNARWFVNIDGRERASPYFFDPNESRESVTAKLCEWILSGAESHTDR